MHLGLVTERGLAQAYAVLLGLPLADPGRYPAEPLLPELLPGAKPPARKSASTSPVKSMTNSARS